jgi:tetratricopeptide (TPR) repeat protein
MSAERIHLYEVLEPVPRRGPGRAYRARTADGGGPLPPGTLVQLRVVGADEAGGAWVLAELEHEHALAVRITAVTVCAPLDFGVLETPEGRVFWSASPWIEGRTLSDLLASAGTIPDLFVDAIAKQAADALSAIHKTGIAAIGLSPETLLVREDTSVLVLDPAFGAAHAASRPRAGRPTAAMSCAAPETLRSRARADEAADLFSLGATLFRAMSGQWHRPDDAQALGCEPESFPARRPSDVHPRASAFLDELVFALIEPDLVKRFDSCEQLMRVLEARRESAWWKSRGVVETPPATVPAPLVTPEPTTELAPPDIPSPAPAPDASWIDAHRTRGLRLARHAAPLVARDEELRQLLDSVRRLRERGGVVRLVRGGPGSGKTRLLDAMLEVLEAMPPGEAPVVLAGEHRRLGIGRPVRGFTEALTRFVAGGRDVTAAQIAPLLGGAAGIAESFAAFLSGREAPPRSVELTPDSIASAFAQCFASIAARTPLVLIVENLQWADLETLQVLEQVARLTAETPLLVVGTFRPVPKTSPLGQTLASVRSLDHAATTRLEPLADADAARLALALLAEDERAETLARRIRTEAEGSALRVVETVRLLEAEGVLVKDDLGRLCATAAAATARLPETEDAIWRRLVAQRPPGERAVLSMAAVQGFAFDANVVAAALGMSALDMERALEGLSAARLIEGAGPGRRFANNSLFDHVHDAVDDAAFAKSHEATAAAYLAARPPDQTEAGAPHGVLAYRVAWHYLLGGRADPGLTHAAEALAHLQATWRLSDADRLAELAARTLAADPDRTGELVDMLLTRADILGLSDRRPEQRELLDEALLRARASGDTRREAVALHDSARMRFAVEELHIAVVEAREALVTALRAGEDSLATNCQALLGAIAFREARYQEARQHIQEMLALARRRSDVGSEAEALYTLGNISQGVGSYEHAEELHRTAMGIYRREGDLAREGDALASLGNIAAASGDVAKAESLLRRALAIERAVGDGHAEARVLGRLGMALQEAQRLSEARAAHVECLQVSRRVGARVNEVVAVLNLATTDYLLGALDDARASYGDAMRAARELHDTRLMGYALTGLGEVARQRGEQEIARGLFERAIGQFRNADDSNGLAAALLAAGRAEVLGGDTTRAQVMLAEARETSVLQNARQAAALALAYLALLAARRGAAEDALATMAEAGAMAEGQRGAEAMRVELMFVHALVLRVLGQRLESDRKLLQAELALVQTTMGLSSDERERVFAGMTPQREILAGATVARSSTAMRERSASGTASV